MNAAIWIQVFGRLITGVLASQGQNDQAKWLLAALDAHRAGKNVDDILQAAADNWAANGPPTFDELAASRAEIQARIG